MGVLINAELSVEANDELMTERAACHSMHIQHLDTCWVYVAVMSVSCSRRHTVCNAD